MEKLKIKVFVYGTLKTGEPNHHVMSETDGEYSFISKATTQDKFPLVVGTKYNIPFLLDQAGQGNNIEGELYEVCEKKLEVLDELEAYPTLYDRKLIEVKLFNGSVDHAFIYLLKSWRPDLLSTSSEMMANYSSQGAHGRPYVDRYTRAKEMLDDIEGGGSNIYHEILGAENPIFIELSQRKAAADLKSSRQ